MLKRFSDLHISAGTFRGSDVWNFLQFVARPDELQDKRVLADFWLKLSLNLRVQHLDLLLAVDFLNGLYFRFICLHGNWCRCWGHLFLLGYDRFGSSFKFGDMLGLLGFDWSGSLLRKIMYGFYFRNFNMIFSLLLRNYFNRFGLFFGGFFDLRLRLFFFLCVLLLLLNISLSKFRLRFFSFFNLLYHFLRHLFNLFYFFKRFLNLFRKLNNRLLFIFNRTISLFFLFIQDFLFLETLISLFFLILLSFPRLGLFLFYFFSKLLRLFLMFIFPKLQCSFND